MAWNRQHKGREWLLSCVWDGLANPTYVTFRHGNEISWISVAEGIARGSSGATFGSLLEWSGNRKVISRYLEKSGGTWFLPFVDKGISGEVFTEADVLEGLQIHTGFAPIKIVNRDQGLVDALHHYERNKRSIKSEEQH